MPLERINEARAWMSKATMDLRVAQIVLNVEPPVIEDALFHCQQAIEKTLKGFLALHDRPIRKTHDLDELGRICEEIDPGLREILQPVRAYTMMAWLFRYPGESTTPQKEEAVEALKMAQNVFEKMIGRLPELA